MKTAIIMRHLFFGAFLTTITLPLLAAEQPNVILIMTDDQGYGDIGAHGNPIIKTPNLDKLYSQSVRLKNFHVNPFCAPTRAALMTGRLSDRTGVWTTIYSRNHLSRGETMMAEFFKASGYRTGHFGKWHLGRNYPYRPIDRGFDQWVGHGDGGTGTSSDYWGNDKSNDHYWRNGKWEKFSGFCTDIYFDEAIKFIDSKDKRPFFVYLATNVPHSPWNVKPPWRKPYEGKVSTGEADFFATISRMDMNLGRLRKFLSDKDLDENTIIIFLTDNGTSGGNAVFNAGMRGRKGSVYDGGHRVPCFIHWPDGGFDKPLDIRRMTGHIDLLPTLVQLCDLKSPKRGHLPLDGRSLLPLLREQKTKWPDRTFVMHVQNCIEVPVKGLNTIVMTERWRLVKDKELYDIIADPAQEKNIAATHPEVVAMLKGRYNKFWKDSGLGTHSWPRPIVGSPHEKETMLVPDGWIRDHVTPDTWNQSHVLHGVKNSGFWPIEITQQGTFLFDLRRWPKEIDHPITASLPRNEKSDITRAGRPVVVREGKAIPAVKIILEIGDQVLTKTIDDTDTNALFEVVLPSGETRVRGWLVDSNGNKHGAYYIYARRK